MSPRNERERERELLELERERERGVLELETTKLGTIFFLQDKATQSLVPILGNS